VRAHLRPLGELDEGDLGAWRELAASAAEPNPFIEPDFALAAHKHLGRDDVGLLIAENRTGWAACLPVRKALRWRKLPVLALASWSHPYCFLGTPLVSPDRADAALGALVERGLRERRVTGLFLDWLGDDGPVASTLGAVFRDRDLAVVRYERFERAALRRRPEPTYLADTLRGHRRRELQRLRRALGDKLGDVLTVRDRSQEPDAFDDFLRIEASGWKGHKGTALAAQAGHADFFRAVCSAYARNGRLQLLELAAAGRAVALKCNLVTNGTVFCFKIAYDAEYARYSPGLQLERDMVDLFHSRTELSSMDSCATPNNQMINRLWPDRRPITTIFVANRGALGAAARQGIAAAAAIRERLQARRVR
jgi:CelD/BcsL family acetyltransferase involved in cellulose biosynthesis